MGALIFFFLFPFHFFQFLEFQQKLEAAEGRQLRPSAHVLLEVWPLALHPGQLPESTKEKEEKSWQHHPLCPLSPARVLHPFWTPSMTTTSQKLWSATVTELARFESYLLERSFARDTQKNSLTHGNRVFCNHPHNQPLFHS